ncbi:hypothetical protein FHR84_000048 [Actinopolyspora biskrensis]|uniref:Uncharacterized protein n=1 Tax=Actinopolyspora biskrensis TaxID=1470178 RepID=A0A852YN64_9ACTN|nr:hypothetical protein [Actinopolyspora biskrensis]
MRSHTGSTGRHRQPGGLDVSRGVGVAIVRGAAAGTRPRARSEGRRFAPLRRRRPAVAPRERRPGALRRPARGLAGIGIRVAGPLGEGARERAPRVPRGSLKRHRRHLARTREPFGAFPLGQQLRRLRAVHTATLGEPRASPRLRSEMVDITHAAERAQQLDALLPRGVETVPVRPLHPRPAHGSHATRVVREPDSRMLTTTHSDKTPPRRERRSFRQLEKR